MGNSLDKRRRVSMDLDTSGINKAKKLLEGIYDTWCEITSLEGEHQEGIFMATNTDDSRLLYEANKDRLILLLTEDQKKTYSDLEQVDLNRDMAIIAINHDKWLREPHDKREEEA